MTGVFACPECGIEVAVEGLSPGREVQCAGCSTFVEVPFLPRVTAPKRGRRPPRRSPWASKALRWSIAFAVVALLTLLATRLIGGRVRSDQERVLAGLLARVDQAEASRRLDEALRQIEAALAHARSFQREGSTRLVELAERRDRVALAEAGGRLAGVDALDPDSAVRESSGLANRVRRDPALASMAGAIEEKLAASMARQAEADLKTARSAFDSGRDVEAFAIAERLYERAKGLSEVEARRSYRDEAEAVIEAAVARSGAALPPINGRFVAGSIEKYAAILDRLRDEALKARGYLPQPRNSPWSGLWDEKAPFTQAVQLTESQDEFYLQSKNRTTLIDGTFELHHNGQVAWKARTVGRTRSPLPDLPAYLAGHLATGARHDPEVEKRFHADAFVQFIEQATRNLRGIPAREVATRVP